MGSRADTEFDTGAEEPSESEPSLTETATEAAEALAGKATGRKPKKSIYLILAGLVVTGVAAGWSWIRRLPKD